MCDIACAAAAGVIARVPCHPLDTIKTVSLCSAGAHEATGAGGLRGAARSIYAREGAAGFYRGVGIASVGSAPGVALYITTYSHTKAALEAPLASVGCHSAVSHLAAGFVAEAVSCVFWVPIDVVKERLQAQDPSVRGRYASSWDGVKCVFEREGLRGLYRGYFVTLGSFGPYSAIYFAAYEGFQARLAPAAGTTDGSSKTAATSGLVGVACGALGNVVACTLTNPLEMVKTRLQVQQAMLADAGGDVKPSRQFRYVYRGLFDGLRTIAREEGVLAGWKGLGSRIAYTAPNAALTFGLYSALKAKLCVGSSTNKL